MENAVIWQSKHTRSSSEFLVSRGNTILYTCTVRYLSGSLKFEFVDSAQKEVLSLRFPVKRKDGLLGKMSKNERNLHTVYSGSVSCGRFSTVHMPFQDDYYKLVYKSNTFSADVIGYGKDGIKILVFNDNEKQIALIEHEVNTSEHMNTYSLYVTDDSLLMILSLFTIYYDRFFLNKPWKNHGRYSPVYCYSGSKQKSIYDPEWINTKVTAEEKFNDIINSDIEEENDSVGQAAVDLTESSDASDSDNNFLNDLSNALNNPEAAAEFYDKVKPVAPDEGDTIRFDVKEEDFTAYFDKIKENIASAENVSKESFDDGMTKRIPKDTSSEEQQVTDSPFFITEIPQENEAE